MILRRYLPITIIFVVSFFLLKNIEFLMKNIYRFVDYNLYTPYYDFSLALIWFVIITILLSFKFEKKFLIIWCIKAFVTLILMLPYESKYKLDAFVYFAGIFNPESSTAQIGSTMNMVYLNYYLSFIVGESYQSLKLIHSLIGFLGLYFIYKTLEFILSKKNIEIDVNFTYLFFLFPTLIFWSSILGKDPLCLFLVGVFIYSAIRLIEHFDMKFLVIILVASFLIYYLRYWFIGFFTFSILMYIIYKYVFKEKFIYFLIFNLLCISILCIMDNSITAKIVSKIQYFSEPFYFGKSKTEIVYYEKIFDYFYYYFYNMFTALYRPHLLDAYNSFMFLSACENIVFLLLSFKYIILHINKIIKNKYIVFLILYIISWSSVYSVISPGNLGTAVRFKLQVMPIILIIIGYSMHLKNRKSVE